jgi:hypothetical protein
MWSEAVAWHVHQDLVRVVETRDVELAELLGIPDEGRTQSDAELLELLGDDIAHLARDGLMSRVHLLVHETELDAATGAYRLLHRATYEAGEPRSARGEGSRRSGGLLRAADLASGGFAMLIGWHAGADPEQRERVTNPAYNLDWRAPEGRYDRVTLVRYRDGSLTADGAAIVRRGEEAVAAALRYLDE